VFPTRRPHRYFVSSMVHLCKQALVNKPVTASVCVASYNYGRFLRQCIESVRAQTLGDWELVISDDCSEDETREIALEYATEDGRIRYYRNETRLGMGGNLRRAAEMASGQYIKMLCSDDWLAPRCLEKLVALMEAYPSVVLATSAETQTDESGTPIRQAFFFGELVSVIAGDRMISRMAAGHGFGGNSSFLIRADAYHAAGGYDPKRLYLVDYDLAARLCRIGDYGHIDQPLFYGRMHGASSSSVNPKRLWDMMDYLDIPREFFAPRLFGSRDWLRYQRLSGSVTARGLTNVAIAFGRRDRRYAVECLRLTLKRGNLPAGLLYLPFHVLRRVQQYAARPYRAVRN